MSSALDEGLCCVWMGNVPQGFDEPRLWQELRAYNVFPVSLAYRPRSDNDCFERKASRSSTLTPPQSYANAVNTFEQRKRGHNHSVLIHTHKCNRTRAYPSYTLFLFTQFAACACTGGECTQDLSSTGRLCHPHLCGEPLRSGGHAHADRVLHGSKGAAQVGRDKTQRTGRDTYAHTVEACVHIYYQCKVEACVLI